MSLFNDGMSLATGPELTAMGEDVTVREDGVNTTVKAVVTIERRDEQIRGAQIRTVVEATVFITEENRETCGMVDGSKVIFPDRDDLSGRVQSIRPIEGGQWQAMIGTNTDTLR